MTKQFTAMAILMLQNQGKLSVQDPLCSYLKSCPEAWKPITLRQLLTHTSGIPDFFSFSDFTQKSTKSMTPDQLADWFAGKPLDFRPGAKFSYSNSGYDLLGYVIEQVSGQPYAAFLKQAIFDPLDMKDTGYDPEPKGLATGYADYSRDYKGDSLDLSVAYAAAGLYSTVGDLYKWDQALYTEALLPQSQLAEMFKAQVDLDPGGYGYGWFVGTVMGHRAELHSGGWYGFSSNITRFPDDKITFIILSNNQVAALDIIEGYIAARILK